jgi:hypothetical protein
VIATLIGYAALAVACRFPVWVDPSHHLGGSQDAEQKAWFFTWPLFALTHSHNPLLSTYINYPSGVNLLWNTAMPAPAILLWPVTALWGAVVTYNLVTTAAIAMAAFFAFLAIKRYVHNRPAAALGGLLYGFSPAMMAQQLGHLTPVLSAVTIPLAFLLFDELFLRQRMSTWLLAILIAAFATFQYFVSEEFLLTEAVAGLTLVVVLALVRRDLVPARLPYAGRVLGVATVLAAALLAYPVFAIQLHGPGRVQGVIHSADIYSTSPLNFVIPEGSEWLTPSFLSSLNQHFSGNASEANAYVGIPLLAMTGYALVRGWRVPLVRAAALTSIVIAVFSLGPHLTPLRRHLFPLPWYPFSKLPLLENVQPSRMMFFVFLGLGFLFAYALQRLWVTRRNPLPSAALAVVVLLPLVPRVPLFWQSLPPTPYFSTPAVVEIPQGSVAYTIPTAGNSSVEAMNWQRESGMRFKLIGGYFIGPESHGQDTLHRIATRFSTPGPHPPISDADRNAFSEELRANRVGVVIVGPMADQAGAVAFFTDALGESPQIRDGFDVWVLSR